ncbi:hypothetical protein CAL7716_058220 [Calothrix sp. PCC 7716]|nr:hypothetical protein CAL7716_058220 [Calothrix sp. PCC 7716]
MSVGISIQFLTGRYHATPWNNQVNEGVVEFPPSPWRIMRALVSSYYRLPQAPPKSELCSLLESLTECLPCYVAPEYTEAHTRHYMPVIKEGKTTTTKVIDAFCALKGGALSSDGIVQVVWQDATLNGEQQSLLSKLCSQVSYIGRAESWVEMKLMDNVANLEFNVVPYNLEENSEKQETTRILTPLTTSQLEGFNFALSTVPQLKKGKSKLKIPSNILEALELDVGDFHKDGWSDVPGARWVTYALLGTNKKLQPVTHDYKNIGKPNFARFALSSKVLPNITQALSIGERFRQALMALSKDADGESASVFSGRKSNSESTESSLLEGQSHAWYLPEVNQQGKIDHIIVYATSGFDFERAVPTLKKLEKIWGSEGFDIQTILVSLGRVDEYVVRDDKHYRAIGLSKKWRSLTPVVLPRHPKCYNNGSKKYISGTSKQLDGSEHQVLKMLTQLSHLNLQYEGNNIIELSEWLYLQDSDQNCLVKVRVCNNGATNIDWRAFTRRRNHGEGKKFSDRGYWFDIEFAQAVKGPIALGYAAHFGLGAFVPI